MNKSTAPKAEKRPKRLRLHGDTRIDDYFWLRDKEDPAVMQYLGSENSYFKKNMTPMARLKNQLYKEMRFRFPENESSVPAADGNYFYFHQYKKGQQYAIHLRKSKLTKKEEVIIDENRLAKGKKYFALSNLDIAPDEQTVVYGVDESGSELYTLNFFNILTGKVYKEQIKGTSGSCVWAKDSQTLFYVVQDKNLRPYRVYRHRLGQNPVNDEILYEEIDPQFFVSLYQGTSKDFIYLHTGGKITDEIWFLRSQDPYGQFQCIERRKEGVEYSVEDRYNEFWILTNYLAKTFQLMKVSANHPQRANWKTVIKSNNQITRNGLSVFSDYAILSERQNGLQQIRVYDIDKKKDHLIKFQDEAYTVSLSDANYEFHTKALRLHYSSPITPSSVLEYDIIARKMKTLKTQKVKGFQPNKYICKRVWVNSGAVKVPMTLVYKKGFKQNGSAPGYLYGYGSYGMSMPDSFPSQKRDVYRLIDRGFVYALAHPRGGSEMGRSWYEDGKFLKKKNTFYDFTACAEYLIKNQWVAKNKLAACGGSAGGLLMGASINLRPELFRVIAAHVPFVDVLNTMLDKDLPLTQLEYKEWGNPQEKKYYRYIKSYSPYDNVEKKDYPHLFVTCGLNDPRVTYWEPAKWVAKLRELKTDDNQILFKTNIGAGHFGTSGRYESLWETAEEYAFILSILNTSKMGS